MTAEVAVLNKGAIALAADSAVTLGQGAKIYHSVNKLFALSRHHAIGIMIYNNGEFTGIPWETLIKMYRSWLGNEEKETLDEYVTHFWDFLQDSPGVVSAEEQEKFFRLMANDLFQQIAVAIQTEIGKVAQSQGSVSDERKSKIADRVVQDEYDHWSALDRLKNWSEKDEVELIWYYDDVLEDLFDPLVQALPLSVQARNQLKEITAWIFSRESSPFWSGLVFAGYGASDKFPAVRTFSAQCMLAEKVRCHPIEEKTVTIGLGPGENAAALVPFAHEDMVQQFMNGISDDLRRQFMRFYMVHIKRSSEFLSKEASGLNEHERRRLAKGLRRWGQEGFKDYRSKIVAHIANTYVEPVMNAIKALPKDELAQLAESMVNLTSLKQRFSIIDEPDAWRANLETVGGPVDVAVISKGDGFIWISRKQYFEAEKNPAYLAKYYRSIDHEQRGQS